MCKKHTKKGPSRCKRKSVVYTSCCQVCKQLGSPDGTYVGETGRTLFERAGEHLEDAANKKESSHIYKHWALNHPDLPTQPEFCFTVIKTHKTPLDRQVHEAVKIAADGSLNSKCEFRQNHIKRLSVSLTSRELRDVESKAAKLDLEIEVAIKNLEQKLSSNTCSNDLSCVPCPNNVNLATPLTCSLPESGIFPDKGQKRPIFESIQSHRSSKKLRFCGDIDQQASMGRSSNGNSYNEMSKTHVESEVD